VGELAVEEQLKKVAECETKNAFEYFVYSKKRDNIIYSPKIVISYPKIIMCTK